MAEESKRGRKNGLSKEEAILSLKAGRDPVLSTSLFMGHLKVWSDLLAEGSVDSFRYQSGRHIFRTALSTATTGEFKSNMEFGLCRSVYVNLRAIHGLVDEDLAPSEPSSAAGSKYILDTGILLLLQVNPERISSYWLDKLKKSKLYYSATSIGEIQAWLEGNDVIKDTVRREDFLALLTNGCHEIPMDSKVMSEAMTLRGEFSGDLHDRIIVATARLHQATVLTWNVLIKKYPYVDSAKP